MPKAINQNITRRTAIAGAAAMIPATAMPALALAGGAEPDPIFEAMENFKRAFAFHGECLAATNAIEIKMDEKAVAAAHAQVPDEVDLYNRHAADREADPLHDSDVTRAYLSSRHNQVRYKAGKAQEKTRDYLEMERLHELGSETEAKAAWAMLDCSPTTATGAAMLITFFLQCEGEGKNLSGYVRYPNNEYEETGTDALLFSLWRYFAHQHVQAGLG